MQVGNERVNLHLYLQGRIQDFQIEGGTKYVPAVYILSHEAQSPFRCGSRACLKALEALLF